MQVECFGIDYGMSAVFGLIVYGVYWIGQMMLLGISKIYCLFLSKIDSEMPKPSVVRMLDNAIGGWSVLLEWTMPLFLLRAVQNLHHEPISNAIVVVVLMLIVMLQYAGIYTKRDGIFPGSRPFVKFGPLVFRYKQRSMWFFVLNYVWFGVVATNQFVHHHQLRILVLLIAIMFRTHFILYKAYKRSITLYAEALSMGSALVWLFTIDKSYGVGTPILVLMSHLVVLLLEISWCYKKQWLKTKDFESVYYSYVV